MRQFALLFEFDGNVQHIRHVMYNCSASHPKIEGKTNEDKKEVQTETLTIKSTPLADRKVKAKTGDTTDSTFYDGWYKAVHLPGSTGRSSFYAAGCRGEGCADAGKSGKVLN